MSAAAAQTKQSNTQQAMNTKTKNHDTLVLAEVGAELVRIGVAVSAIVTRPSLLSILLLFFFFCPFLPPSLCASLQRVRRAVHPILPKERVSFAQCHAGDIKVVVIALQVKPRRNASYMRGILRS